MRRSRVLPSMLALALAACAPASIASRAELQDDTVPRAPVRTLRAHPAVSALDATSRGVLRSAPVPMLVLPAAYAGATQIMSGDHWTALAYHDEAITITLHATATWHDALGAEELAALPEPEATVRGQRAWETVNEAIRSLSWTEGEVAYALEIECARAEDARCTESEHLMRIASELVSASAEGSP